MTANACLVQRWWLLTMSCVLLALAGGCAGNQAALTKAAAVEKEGVIAAAPTRAELTASKSTQIKVGSSLLSNGSNLTGRLVSTDPRLADNTHYQAYLLRAREGDRVTIVMRSSQVDSYLIVRDTTNDQAIAMDDDSAGGLDALATFVAPTTGDYHIYANTVHADETGSYALSVQIESQQAAPVRQDGLPIQVGQTLSGRLVNADPRLDDDSPFHRYTFAATLGQRVRIDMTSTEVDTYLILGYMDTTGFNSIASNDDGEDGTNARIDYEVQRDGTFVVMATVFDPNARGSYQISLQQTPGEDLAVPPPAGGWGARYQDSSADDKAAYAVLVGIDDYPGESNDLPSCVADTMLLRNVLINRYGFKPENVVMIHNSAATREHIFAAIDAHLGKAGPDGLSLFYFSGHGMQMDGNYYTQDDEPDRVDEAVVVWGLTQSASVLLDDEMGEAIAGLKSQRRQVILDTCHSGTGSRALGDFRTAGKEVFVEDIEIEIPASWAAAVPVSATMQGASRGASQGVSKSGMDTPQNHLLLAAARADQVAQARTGWSTHGGVASTFTYFLVRELEEGDANRSWTELIEAVNARILEDARQQGYDMSSVQEAQAEGARVNRTVRQHLSAP